MMKFVRMIDWKSVEDFLAIHPSAPTHWPEWNRIVSKHYGTEFFYFVAYEENKLIGICPVHKVNKSMQSTLFSGQFHFIPYGGWILSEKVSEEGLCFPIRGNEAISGFALPCIDGYAQEWKMRQSVKLMATLCLDLAKEEEWLWMNAVDSKRRNMIRKATKNRIQVETVDKDNFAVFYDLYRLTNEMHGLISLSKDCLSELFFNTEKITFWGMLTWHNDRALSAIVIVFDKDYALYWLGAGAADAPNLGQGELLQWEAIKHAKRAGCKFYDLCYIEKERLPAIYEFKKGFAKDEYSVVHFSQRSFGYRLLNKLSR